MDSGMEFLVFYAFDIVNSTALKIYRGKDSWLEWIRDINDEVLRLDYLRLWKFLGDEWVLYRSISSFEDFNRAHTQFLSLMLRLDLKPIKYRAWIIPDHKSVISLVVPPFRPDDSKYDEEKGEYSSSSNNYVPDWVSLHLDIAFRIGKQCHIGDIALSVEYAYVLSQEAARNFRGGCFYKHEEQNLKGISVPYPNIVFDISSIRDKGREKSWETGENLYGIQRNVCKSCEEKLYGYTKQFIKNTFNNVQLYDSLIQDTNDGAPEE